MKLKMNQSTLSSVSAAALLAFCHLPGHAAGDDDTPFSLKLSETVLYDTNYSRTTEKKAEVISSTAVELGINKPYGRQTYTGSGRFAFDKHKNYQEQDNRNYDVDLGFNTGIASNWSLSANGSASESLTPVENNALGDRLAKNTRSYRGTGLSLRYGVSGRWAMVGSVSASKTSYSLASAQYQNQSQGSGGLRLIYSTSDLLNFGVGGSMVKSRYPNRLINGISEEVTQHSLDFSTDWQVTGFSVLSAVLSLAENKYKSDPTIKFSGVTGRMNWKYTPSGLTSYELSLSRSTDDDSTTTFERTGSTYFDPKLGQFIGALPADSRFHNLTTSLEGTVRWMPTAKLSFNAGLAWRQFEVSREQTVFNQSVPARETSSNHTAISLGSDYQYSRALGFGCNYQHYKQGAESDPSVTYGNPRVPYAGNQYNCTASFKID